MKLRFNRKGGIAINNFKLTLAEIEQQVDSDLLRYRNFYSTRYGSFPATPLDVENFVKELWGIDVGYEDLAQSDEEEILGFFDPENHRIVVDARICNNPRRLSFTVGHEAGHLSLHSFLFKFDKGKITGWKNGSNQDKNLERQADHYAAALLAPKREVYAFIKERGLSFAGVLVAPIDMTQYAPIFQEKFGLSRQALEIRLLQLGVSLTNRKYAD